MDGLFVTAQSTTGMSPQGEKIEVSTSMVHTVEVITRGTGALEGAGIGVVVPATLRFMRGTVTEDVLSQDVLQLTGIVLSLPGAVVGGIIGARRGHREIYRLSTPPLNPGSIESHSQAAQRRDDTAR